MFILHTLDMINSMIFYDIFYDIILIFISAATKFIEFSSHTLIDFQNKGNI